MYAHESQSLSSNGRIDAAHEPCYSATATTAAAVTDQLRKSFRLGRSWSVRIEQVWDYVRRGMTTEDLVPKLSETRTSYTPKRNMLCETG